MDNQNNNFYLTTAINYTNGSPHCGHAYEIICADILARYHKLYNKQVFFSTGSDEHGMKISETAKLFNMEPIELCNKYVAEFQNLNKMLNINEDAYIRTTDKAHMDIAKIIWDKVVKNGDIYFGEYNGWYDMVDEKFITETEAAKCDYIDVRTGKSLAKRSEPCYMFKLSSYQNAIIDHINNNPDYIKPLERRDEILMRLTTEKLEDLSISRTKKAMDWGIEIDDEHVMYVWFDALINYLSVIGYPDDTNFKFWPANIHLIGKDICWFHTVIWTAMLMSLKLELPTTILAHGFVNDSEGHKMSKSIGNVIDPTELLENYDPDVLRIYLAQATNIGPDLNISEADMISVYDHQLVAKFSNLVNRCLVLITKLNNGQIPAGNITLLFGIETLKNDIYNKLTTFKTKDILSTIYLHLDIVNKYFSDLQPWLMQNSYLCVLRTVLEAIYILGHFLFPFMPKTMEKLFGFIGVNMCNNINDLTWNNLNSDTKLNEFSILFKQIGKTRNKLTAEEKQIEKLKIEQIRIDKKNRKTKKLI